MQSAQVIPDKGDDRIFRLYGENQFCHNQGIHKIANQSECLIMAAEAKMKLKHFLGTISALVPVSLVIYILFAVFRYLGFMTDEQSTAKTLLTNLLIFLIIFPTAIWSCKIWGKLLMKLNIINFEQAKKYPFHKL